MLSAPINLGSSPSVNWTGSTAELASLKLIFPAKEQEMIQVKFDDHLNPTAADLAKLKEPVICDHFELRNGVIGPKFVPIREKIMDPTGRTDYGWNDALKRSHLQSAYARKWPEFPYVGRPHDGVMHIVGGGPSLKRCLPALRKMAKKPKNFVLALNKSHDFLLNLPKLGLGQAIKPWGGVLLDPCEWVKDYITPRPGIQYLIGDQCGPATFDVFDKPEFTKYIWRATNPAKDRDLVPQAMHFIGGGSTVGLRSRTLAYYFGFRRMHYWGFDSSAEVTDARPDGKMHGYEKEESVKDRVTVRVLDENGFEQEFVTNTHMARQAQEWLEDRDKWIENVRAGRVQWIYETFHGDGLLPTIAARLNLHADKARNFKGTMETLTPGVENAA